MALTMDPFAPADNTPAVARDNRLARAIRAGDEQAFETLYRAYHVPLWRFAYLYVRSSAIAEELVQDVFLSLWTGRASWDVHTSVRAWLYGAVRHRALKHGRREQLAARVAPLAASPSADSHEVVEGLDLERAVTRAIGQLPERRRQAIILRWKHALSTPEIARVLQTTPASVRVLLTRARADLAELIGLTRSV